MTSDGNLEESSASEYFQPIFLKLHFELTKYINKNGCFNIPDSEGKNINLDTASFFLKNKHLKDFDFCYWDNIEEYSDSIDVNTAIELLLNDKKQKSIKKAVYENYKQQLNYNGKFHSFFIEAFCNSIYDTNILEKFLKLELDYAENHIINKDDLILLINFLKNYYTEIQILNLFSKYNFNTDSYLFRDTLNVYISCTESVKNKFRKVHCSFLANLPTKNPL